MSRDLRNHKTFRYIRHFLKKVFAFYMKLYPEEKIKSFYDLMMKELDNFAVGRVSRQVTFCFTDYLDYNSREYYEFTSFNIENSAMTIFCGGNTWHESYMDIEYYLWGNGDEDELFNLEIDSFISFIRNGAILEIEYPEEYK